MITASLVWLGLFHTTSLGPSDSPGESEVVQVAVEVDPASLLPEEYPPAARASALYVQEDVTTALERQHGFVVFPQEDRPDVPVIVVELDWENYDDAVYRISLATRLPGQAEDVVTTFTATCIDSTALTSAVVQRLPEAVEQLREPPHGSAAPATTPSPSGPGEPEPKAERQPDVEPSPASEPQRRRLGLVGITGVGLGATGLASMIAGGIVYSRAIDYDPPAGRLRRGRDHQPSGLGLLIGGGAALATGAVLLIVDRARSRPRRFGPTAGIGQGSLHLGITATF